MSIAQIQMVSFALVVIACYSVFDFYEVKTIEIAMINNNSSDSESDYFIWNLIQIITWSSLLDILSYG